MKALKYVLGVLLLMITGYLLIGILNPTIHYTNTIEINKPVPESFAVFMDESKMDQWMTGYKGIKTLEGNPGEVGSVNEITIEQEGKTFVMTETVKVNDENERYAFLLSNEVLHNDMDIRFSAKGADKTLLTSTTEVKGKNMIFRSLFPLIKSNMVSEDAAILERLKQVIESNDTDYFPAKATSEITMESTPDTISQ